MLDKIFYITLRAASAILFIMFQVTLWIKPDTISKLISLLALGITSIMCYIISKEFGKT